jgi:hypothetical protein
MTRSCDCVVLWACREFASTISPALQNRTFIFCCCSYSQQNYINKYMYFNESDPINNINEKKTPYEDNFFLFLIRCAYSRTGITGCCFAFFVVKWINRINMFEIYNKRLNEKNSFTLSIAGETFEITISFNHLLAISI